MKDLRNQVKALKVYQNISYKEIAEYLEIKQSSFYSWLNRQYELSEYNQKKLIDIIETLKD